MANDNSVPSAQDITDFTHLSQGYIKTQLLLLSAKLGLSSILADGSKSLAQLAQLTNCHPPTLARFLRAMVNLRIISQTDDQQYQKGPLLPLVDGVLTPFFDDTSLASWTHAMHTLKTGQPGWDQVFGCPFYQHLDSSPEQSQAFDRWNANSVIYLDPLLSLYDFAQFNQITDLGGGWGGFMIKVLQQNPQTKATIFDRAEVIMKTRKVIEHSDVADRLSCQSGDFFDQIPSGADCYTLCRVLLNWDDQQVIEILKNCKTAMAKNSKLLILDFCIPKPSHPNYSALVNNDLNLLVNLGGASRSTEQLQALIEAAGLTLNQTIMAPSSFLFMLEVSNEPNSRTSS